MKNELNPQALIRRCTSLDLLCIQRYYTDMLLDLAICSPVAIGQNQPMRQRRFTGSLRFDSRRLV
ncbi:MAG TPA: hypothetical protein VGO51_13340 [Burkholderiaceae bacterium]|jgi:hypothetical protein|nr:hypothetical protein [Burkholderiaceae bacterium]